MSGASVVSTIFAVLIFGFAFFVIAMNVIYVYQTEKTGHFISLVFFVPTILAVIGSVALGNLPGHGGRPWHWWWWLTAAVVVLEFLAPAISYWLFRALRVGRVKPDERTLLAVFKSGTAQDEIHATRQHLTGRRHEGRNWKAFSFPQVRGAFEAQVDGQAACRVVFRAGTSSEQQAEVREMLRAKPVVAEIRQEPSLTSPMSTETG